MPSGSAPAWRERPSVGEGPAQEESRGVGLPHRGGRSAAGAAAAIRHRAERRHHAVGVGAGRQLHPRQRVDRQAQADAVWERQSLWPRYRPELFVGARSGDQLHFLARDPAPDRSRPRSRATGRIQGLTSSHNPMLDDKGNVWITTRVRGREAPGWVHQATFDIQAGRAARTLHGSCPDATSTTGVNSDTSTRAPIASC